MALIANTMFETRVLGKASTLWLLYAQGVLKALRFEYEGRPGSRTEFFLRRQAWNTLLEGITDVQFRANA